MIRECSEEDKELSNIISYYGATYDYDDKEYGIVMEYCPQYSLSDYLTNNWKEVSWKKNYKSFEIFLTVFTHYIIEI